MRSTSAVRRNYGKIRDSSRVTQWGELELTASGRNPGCVLDRPGVRTARGVPGGPVEPCIYLILHGSR